MMANAYLVVQHTRGWHFIGIAFVEIPAVHFHVPEVLESLDDVVHPFYQTYLDLLCLLQLPRLFFQSSEYLL